MNRTKLLEKDMELVNEICMNCLGCRNPNQIECESLDCPIYFERSKVSKQIASNSVLLEDAGIVE